MPKCIMEPDAPDIAETLSHSSLHIHQETAPSNMQAGKWVIPYGSLPAIPFQAKRGRTVSPKLIDTAPYHPLLPRKGIPCLPYRHLIFNNQVNFLLPVSAIRQ